MKTLKESAITVLRFAEQHLDEMNDEVKDAVRAVSQWIEHGRHDPDQKPPNGWYAILDEDAPEDCEPENRWVFAPIAHFDEHGTIPDEDMDTPQLPSGFDWVSEGCAEFWGKKGNPRELLSLYGFTINENPIWWQQRIQKQS